MTTEKLTPNEARALGLRVTAWMLARGFQEWPAGTLVVARRALRRMVGRGWPGHNAWPDLRDPATFGVIVGALEEALGFPVCFYVPRIARLNGSEGWLVESAHDNGQSLATDDVQPTRAHALVNALEAVP